MNRSMRYERCQPSPPVIAPSFEKINHTGGFITICSAINKATIPRRTVFMSLRIGQNAHATKLLNPAISGPLELDVHVIIKEATKPTVAASHFVCERYREIKNGINVAPKTPAVIPIRNAP